MRELEYIIRGPVSHGSRNLLCCAFLFFSLILPKALLAESIPYFGLSFKAEDYKEIDQQHVQAKLSDSVQLYDKKEFKRLLALSSLKSSQHNYSSDDLSRFGKRVLEQSKDLELAGLAFAVALENKEDTESFMAYLSSLPYGVELAQEVLLAVSTDSKTFATLVFFLGQDQVPWFRTNLQPKLFKAKRNVFQELRTRCLSSVSSNKLSEIEKAFTFYGYLFGEQNSELRDLRSELTRIEIAAEKIDAEQYVEAQSLLEPFSSEKHAADFARAVVSLINAKSRALLEIGQPTRAIHVLSLINFRYRTPDSHSIVLQAFSKLSLAEEPIWSNSRTDTFVLTLSKKDSEVFEAYLSYILSLVEKYKKAPEDFPKLKTALKKLSLLRPDPNAENDQLRIDLTLELHKKGRETDSLEVLNSLKRDLGFFEKIRLFTAGVFIKPSLLVLILALPVILWIIIRILVKMYYKPKRQLNRLHSEAKKAREPSLSPRFIKREGLDPRIVEYLELLNSLQLSDKASEKEIKTAYRNKMKTLHPDLRQTTTDMTQDFVKLKSVYERILELRDELGL